MSDRKPVSSKVITPPSYLQINFGCSNRAFYEVKNTIIEVANSIEIEWSDGYFEEKCDYEGDLEEIILYRGRENILTKAVLKHYGIEDAHPELNVHLSLDH